MARTITSRTFPFMLLGAVLIFCLCSAAEAEVPAAPQQTAAAKRAIRAFDLAKANPLELHALLAGMPKGADLHMHLSGAIYAETFLKEAAEDKLCIDRRTLSFTAGGDGESPCGRDLIPAANALKDQKLYDALVDSFSMRAFVPTPGTTGHDQFFATFARFGAVADKHAGDWLDEVATRAAAQNEQYLEIMQTPPFRNAAKLGYAAGWSAEASAESGSPTRATLAALRDTLLARGLRDEVAVDRAELAEALATRNRLEQCGTPAARPACSVQIRFLAQVLRAFPPQQVFAQTLLYFELAAVDPDVVGINFVQPEDAYLAMSEYHSQMLMLDYLHSVYPKVHISLHAGEIAPGLVPPEGLRFHIREAVELAHAERIGHGVDVMQEDNPHALLSEMADRHIMVEINLTSNDVILGVSANHHSLPAYRAAHVPVALSTDDEGVSRIDLTHEYARAATEFHLGYLDLKAMARASLEHSFLNGASLWQQPDTFTRVAPACASDALGAAAPSARCVAFLQSSEKAAQQWELEHRYQIFESTLP